MAADRLGSISAFVRVAKLGSFASAGKALGISSSGVSKSVARLEERLGLRLFQRTTRAVILTDDGRDFFRQCERILSELEAAEQTMADRAAAPSGILKVELPAALGRMRIAPALSRLTGLYPDLRVEASFSDHLTDLYEAGLDAVVRIGEPQDTRLMVKRVGSVQHIVCSAPSYIEAHGEPRSPDELPRFECIGRAANGATCPGAWKFATPDEGAPLELEPSGRLRFDSSDVIIDAGLAGAGLVVDRRGKGTPLAV